MILLIYKFSSKSKFDVRALILKINILDVSARIIINTIVSMHERTTYEIKRFVKTKEIWSSIANNNLLNIELITRDLKTR